MHSLFLRRPFSTSANAQEPLNRALNSDKALPHGPKPIHMRDAQLRVTLGLHQHPRHGTTCLSHVLNRDSFPTWARHRQLLNTSENPI